MPSEIRIYYEGDPQLRSGFRAFFQTLRDQARGKRCGFEVIAAGSGNEACRDFENALKSHPKAWNILLIDREGPSTGNMSVTLCQKQKWNRSHADSIFWMVQMMESWFHADKDALEKYYGEGFNRSALRTNPNVEQIPKQDLKDGLKRATKDTKKRGYHKTSHGPELLAKIRPDVVQKAAPNCKKLFEAVLAKLA